MEPGEKKLTSLKDVIASLLGDGGLPFNPDDARIWDVWQEVVGIVISKNAHPMWIKEGKLKVAVSEPIWLQELEYSEQEIREKLNQKLGREAVQKIEFRMESSRR